jgi:5-methyltetrahydrofolate--homocysteine methyltransferase
VLEEGNIDLVDVFSYINPAMLYGKHLGLKGRLEEKLAADDPKAVELHTTVNELQERIISEGLFRPRGAYRFYRAVGEGNDLVLLDHAGRREEARFSFGRQQASPYRCLSDFVLPRTEGRTDSIALFLVTVGHGVMEQSHRWKEEGRYLLSHALQALALETAEAMAEWLHVQIREMWGIPDPADLSRSDLFKARYRGRRFSFGYPACPDLRDQELLFRLLDAEASTGVSLTEGYMMDPEASVSALVFHHPQAEYFNLR